MKTRLIFAWLMVTALTSAGQAQTHLTGALSGAYQAGYYYIDGPISVDPGTTVTLMPGVSFNFTGWYPLTIQGTLIAEGTAQDSIFFSCNPATNPNKWKGLRFSGAGASGSRLSYCRISYGRAESSTESNGGGIYCNGASPIISHTRISNCTALMDGGGVCAFYSNMVLENCLIDHCTAALKGGGLRFGSSNVTLRNCIISYNSAATDGGGIYMAHETLTNAMLLENCLIDHNASGGT